VCILIPWLPLHPTAWQAACTPLLPPPPPATAPEPPSLLLKWPASLECSPLYTLPSHKQTPPLPPPPQASLW